MRQPSKLTETISAAVAIRLLLLFFVDLCITKRGESVVKYFGLHGCEDHEILQGSRNLGMHLSK